MKGCGTSTFICDIPENSASGERLEFTTAMSLRMAYQLHPRSNELPSVKLKDICFSEKTRLVFV
jgi:hypothetical protein